MDHKSNSSLFYTVCLVSKSVAFLYLLFQIKLALPIFWPRPARICWGSSLFKRSPRSHLTIVKGIHHNSRPIRNIRRPGSSTGTKDYIYYGGQCLVWQEQLIRQHNVIGKRITVVISHSHMSSVPRDSTSSIFWLNTISLAPKIYYTFQLPCLFACGTVASAGAVC